MNKLYSEFAKESYFRTSDGTNLHYVEAGSGEVLIAIPGWSGTEDFLMFCLKSLAEKYHVYILESRGHGASDVPEKGYRISRLAMDAREFFESLQIEKANWMAHSMGCSVLWCYYDLFGSGTIKKWILIDEPPFLLANPQDSEEEVLEYGGQRIDLWQIYNAYQDNWKEGQNSFDRYFQMRLYDENNEQQEALYSQLTEENDETKNQRRFFLGKLLFDHLTNDWRDVIPLIRVPTLYISGDVSHATNEKCAKWVVDSIPECQWVRFSKEEYGTHSMMINSPEIFSDAVIRFLGEGLE